MINVKLLRQLDGRPAGETADYPEEDAKRLAADGIVEIVGKAPAAPKTKDDAPSENKSAAKTAKKAD